MRFAPDYAESHYNLGVALGALGKLEDAIGHYELAVRFAPDYAEAHYNLGLALAQLGKVQEAIQQYEQALRIKPKIAKAHYHLGIALEQTGLMREAVLYRARRNAKRKSGSPSRRPGVRVARCMSPR